MQVQSPPTSIPLILETLPNPDIAEGECPRRARVQIDLLLLAIEALDLGGSEEILVTVNELDLKSVIRNRVSLWRMRSTNPWRQRFNPRRPLSLTEAKALVTIACHLARRLTVLIRQLLIIEQQLREKNLPLDQHYLLAQYLERFRAHFRARMNPRRSQVSYYFDHPNGEERKPQEKFDRLDDLAIDLLGQLLFCTGTAGAQRLWSSLFDGEVA